MKQQDYNFLTHQISKCAIEVHRCLGPGLMGILPVHDAQPLTYLKLSNKKLGLLIIFNVPVLKDGIRRKINGKLNHK